MNPGHFRRLRLETLDDILAWCSPEPNSGCWLWTRTLHEEGYAITRPGPGAKKKRIHRLSYQMAKGQIPEGYEPDHLCRTRACVNPDHIEAVPKLVNIRRGNSIPAQRGRQTHCLRGHPFDEANTHINKHGYRNCRACQRIKNAAKRAAARSS